MPPHERTTHASPGTPVAASTTPAHGANPSRYLADARDWPSPRRAATYLPRWLGEADEVRAGLGGRAARRFLELTYVAEQAHAADFALREDNHRLAATQYLTVARSAIATNGGVLTSATEPEAAAQPA